MLIDNDREMVHLNIGDVHISRKPEQIWTVLGSCITVILYSPKSPITAMCHAQLPEKNNYDYQCYDHCPHPCYNLLDDDQELKYVSCSIRYMLEKLAKEGLQPPDLQAMIIGGAAVIKNSKGRFAIGKRNVEYTEAVLTKNRIAITYRDTGGEKSRQILFNTKDRTVKLK